MLTALSVPRSLSYARFWMSHESEWQTRKQRIDARLKKLGWNIVPFSDALNLAALDKTAVEELPIANGPADYALFVGGKLLGIIEAKKVTVNPRIRDAVSSVSQRADERLSVSGCVVDGGDSSSERNHAEIKEDGTFKSKKISLILLVQRILHNARYRNFGLRYLRGP